MPQRGNDEKPFPRDIHGFVMFHDYMQSDRGFYMPPHMIPAAAAALDRRIPNLAVLIGPGSSKSTCLSQTLPAFEIGHDPTMTILGLSAGEALMQGFMHAVMEWIEHSSKWKQAFPTVRPDKRSGWSSEKGMFVTGRTRGDPDSSYFAAGLTSSALTGKHSRLIIVDDIHNKENSQSSDQCKKVWDTWNDTIVGRADPKGARFIVAGRRWRSDDVYSYLIGSGDFVVMELPAQRDGTELYWSIKVPEGLDCCFTDGSMVTAIDDVKVG